MEKSNEFVCNFCNKKFSSVKALGGHSRIHSKQKKKNNKRLVDQRDSMATKQLCCKECGKGFSSFKALAAHMGCHHIDYEKKMMMDTETSSVVRMKRSKRRRRVMMAPSNLISYSNAMALSRLIIYMDSKGHNLLVNSPLAQSSENNSAILETKSSSGEQLKIVSVKKNQVLETKEIAVDDDDDEDNGCSDYDDCFMYGPNKSDSDISVDKSLKNTGVNSSLNRFRNSDELVRGSKHEMRKSKCKRVFPSYETDSCAETKSKIHSSSHSKSSMVKKAGCENKQSKVHQCPICFKEFKSGKGLGGHKKSHSIENYKVHRIEEKNQVAEPHRNKFDLNLLPTDTDE